MKNKNHPFPSFLLPENAGAYAFLFAALLTLLAGFLLSFIPTTIDPAQILELFFMPELTVDAVPMAFIPSKSEIYQLFVCTILFPLSYLCFYKLFIRKSAVLPRLAAYKTNAVFHVLSILLPLALLVFLLIQDPYFLGLLGVSTPRMELVPAFDAQDYITMLASLAAAVLLFFIYNRFQNRTKWLDRILLICGIAIMVLAATHYFTKSYFLSDNYYDARHAEAYIYPVYKVFSGQTPGVDFTSIYGFASYLLAPIFILTGGFSVFRFSIVMAALCFISFLALFLGLYFSCKNKVIALLGSFAVVYLLSVFQMIIPGGAEYYLQYVPHRILFFSLLFFVSALLLRIQKRTHTKILIGLGYLLCALSVIWSTESGLVCIVAFGGFNIYRLLLSHRLQEPAFWKKCLLHLALGILCVVFAIAFILLMAFLRTGTFPTNIMDFFLGPVTFYEFGYGKTLLEPFSFWLLPVSIYAVALAKSIRHLNIFSGTSVKTTAPNEQSALYFLLAVLGMGAFVYYQGRGHLNVLVSASWPAMALLVLFLQEYYQKISASDKAALPAAPVPEQQPNPPRWYRRERSGVLFTKFIAAFVAVSLFFVPFLYRTWQGKRIHSAAWSSDVEIYSPMAIDMNEAVQFISAYRTQDEPVAILSRYDVYIYIETHIKDTVPMPAMVDRFTVDSYRQSLDAIRQNDLLVLISKDTYAAFMIFDETDFSKILGEKTLLAEGETYYIYR